MVYTEKVHKAHTHKHKQNKCTLQKTKEKMA